MSEVLLPGRAQSVASNSSIKISCYTISSLETSFSGRYPGKPAHCWDVSAKKSSRNIFYCCSFSNLISKYIILLDKNLLSRVILCISRVDTSPPKAKFNPFNTSNFSESPDLMYFEENLDFLLQNMLVNFAVKKH